MASTQVVIAPGHGQAFVLEQGQSLRVINLEGAQVADCWAFVPPDLREFVSAEHTRSCLEKLVPAPGDALYSNFRQPLLSLVEDHSPGTHDLLMSACDARRYALLGHEGFHRSCADNLLEALADLGERPAEIPSPFNIFQNVEVGSHGRLQIVPPKARAGDSVTLRVERALIVVLSACPMDLAMTNGRDGRIKPIGVEID